MGIRFILMVNKQGQTRLAQYYENLSIPKRLALEGEIVCKCLARTEQQTLCFALFFLAGVDNNENELAILEFINLQVETVDHHFGNVCELDIMIHLEKEHFIIVEEMVMNDCIVQRDKNGILPLFISWTEYRLLNAMILSLTYNSSNVRLGLIDMIECDSSIQTGAR